MFWRKFVPVMALCVVACGDQIPAATGLAAPTPVTRLVVEPNSIACISVLIPANPPGITSVGLNFGSLAELSNTSVGAQLCAENHEWDIVTKQVVISTRDAVQLHIVQIYMAKGELVLVVETN